jgi:hypothetical protein
MAALTFNPLVLSAKATVRGASLRRASAGKATKRAATFAVKAADDDDMDFVRALPLARDAFSTAFPARRRERRRARRRRRAPRARPPGTPRRDASAYIRPAPPSGRPARATPRDRATLRDPSDGSRRSAPGDYFIIIFPPLAAGAPLLLARPPPFAPRPITDPHPSP